MLQFLIVLFTKEKVIIFFLIGIARKPCLIMLIKFGKGFYEKSEILGFRVRNFYKNSKDKCLFLQHNT